MKTIKTNNAELLLVKVPRDASDFKVFHENKHTRLLYDVGKTLCYSNHLNKNVVLPKMEWFNLNLNEIVNYQIVNTLSKLTEEQAKELVEDCDMYRKCYKKYNKIEMSSLECIHSTFMSKVTCFTALESFQSLMAVNEVYLSNPFDVKNMPDPYKYVHHPDEYDRLWQQAEKNTSEYLILIKK